MSVSCRLDLRSRARMVRPPLTMSIEPSLAEAVVGALATCVLAYLEFAVPGPWLRSASPLP
jgi:hypothetical protein